MSSPYSMIYIVYYYYYYLLATDCLFNETFIALPLSNVCIYKIIEKLC